jgi:hypothetical protein
MKAFVGKTFLKCAEVVESGMCSDNKFWGHCRESCNKCNKCRDSKAKIKVMIDNGKKRKKKCSYVANNKELCDDVNIFNACGKTCGACS